MIMYTLVLLLFLGILLYELYIRFKRNGRLGNKIPGPIQFPLFVYMIASVFFSQVGVFKLFRLWANTYYPLTRLWIGPKIFICIMHPDDLEIFLSNRKTLTKNFLYDFFQPFVKKGLITSSGELWHQRRKLLGPTFNYNILKKYNEIIIQHSEIMMNELKSQNEKHNEILLPLFSKVALRIICESTMGVALNKIDPKVAQKYGETVHKMTSIAIRRMSQPYITDFMLKLFPFMPLARDMNKTIQILNEFTNNIVEERRKYHENTGGQYLENLNDDSTDEINDTSKGRKKKLAMLDYLLSLERDGLIDDAGIKEEVDTFTAAGHDTTSVAMLFTVMLLAENKDAQEQARIEVTKIMDQNEGKLLDRNLQEMPYLERCIKESLRLYPPVCIVGRYVYEDIQLKHGIVSANSDVLLFFYDVHRNPEFWEKPEVFDPDRFLPENIRNQHPFAYLPFSAGPRNCLGQRYVMNEMKSLLAYILYNFYLESIDKLADIDLIFDVVMQPSKPVSLKFIKIQKEKK